MTTKITVTAQILAPVEKVWNSFTHPEHITKWNFASDDWHCPTAKNDVRIGGKYNARMEAKDGSIGFNFEYIYDNVIDHKELAYTMCDGRQAVTTFESMGDTTNIITIFDAENENSVELQQQGWLTILNNFKTYTEQ